MKQNKFDLVMDYIDENIQADTETIKRGIINLIGINSNSLGQYFTVLTGDTLGSYSSITTVTKYNKERWQ